MALFGIVTACGGSDDDSGGSATTAEPGSQTTESVSGSSTTTGDTEPSVASTTTDGTETTEAATTAPVATTATQASQPTATEPAASGGDVTVPGSPIVPASSVDLAAVPNETAIVVIGDDALVYSVVGPGVRKCLAAFDEVVIEGRFVDDSGEVMQTDNFDTGEFVLRDGEDGDVGLLFGDGINGRGYGAGSSSILGLDASGGQIDEFDATAGVVRGSATVVDLVSGDGSTVEVEFGVNCG